MIRARERARRAFVGSDHTDTYSHVVAGLQEDAALRIDASLRKLLAS